MSFHVGRYLGRERLEFECKVVTPMFLAGADGKTPEIRAASIKGVLRFWWRALNGHLSIEELKKREGEIFGSTERKSSFSVKVVEQKLSVKNSVNRGKSYKFYPNRPASDTIEYLGYGISEYDRQTHGMIWNRDHIVSGSSFKLRLDVATSKHLEEIETTVKVFLNFGGLGAKSRNGFGSVQAREVQNEDFSKFIKKIERPQFTHFTTQAVLFNDFKEHSTWNNALSEVGLCYRAARLLLEPKHKFEERAAMTSPLIVRHEVNINARLAKPYFMKVFKLENESYRGQILCLPSKSDRQYLQVISKMNNKLQSCMTGGVQ